MMVPAGRDCTGERHIYPIVSEELVFCLKLEYGSSGFDEPGQRLERVVEAATCSLSLCRGDGSQISTRSGDGGLASHKDRLELGQRIERRCRGHALRCTCCDVVDVGDVHRAGRLVGPRAALFVISNGGAPQRRYTWGRPCLQSRARSVRQLISEQRGRDASVETLHPSRHRQRH